MRLPYPAAILHLVRFVQLAPEVRRLLRCPLCKGDLTEGVSPGCLDCDEVYRTLDVDGENVLDLRVIRPESLRPPVQVAWEKAQHEYEAIDRDNRKRATREEYLAGIEGVREIYTRDFKLEGSVLDVGGHVGTLRHFLPADALYVSVDPYVGAFSGLALRTEMRAAYPRLDEPCNFIGGVAEALPFATRTFDWVHMRSVLDHFNDPYVAMREARRVLRPEAHVLIGLSVTGGTPPLGRRSALALARRATAKLLEGGPPAVMRAARNRIGHGDEHLFHWTYDQLIELLGRTGFVVTREDWQKPPLNMVVYIQAQKR